MKTSHNSRSRHIEPMDALRTDLAAIRQDISSLLTNRWTSLSEDTKAALSSAGDTLRETAKHAGEQAGAAHRKLSQTAGNRPLTTIVVAAATGIVAARLLGWMLRR